MNSLFVVFSVDFGGKMGVIKPIEELKVKKEIRISKDSAEILKQYSAYKGIEIIYLYSFFLLE